jgi:hypothetical protein
MKCCICLKTIKLDQKISQCVECHNSTHYVCYLKWIKEKKQCVCPYCNFNSDFTINHKINIQEPTSSEDNDTSSSSDDSQLDNNLFDSDVMYQVVNQLQENRSVTRIIQESTMENSRFFAMICLLFSLIGMFSIILESTHNKYLFNHTHY